MTVDATTISFLEKLNEDAGMQAALEAALEGSQDKTGAVVALAASNGFQIDRASFDAARTVLAAAMHESGALGESELEAIAGGFNPQPEPPARVSDLAGRIQLPMKKLMLSW